MIKDRMKMIDNKMLLLWSSFDFQQKKRKPKFMMIFIMWISQYDWIHGSLASGLKDGILSKYSKYFAAVHENYIAF